MVLGAAAGNELLSFLCVVQRLRSAGLLVLPHRLHETVTLPSGWSLWLYWWPSMRQSNRFKSMPQA